MVAGARPGALSRCPAPLLLIGNSRAGSPGPLDGRKRKDGAAQAPPRTALLIRGSKPDPRRVRTGAQIAESGTTKARAFEPFLEPVGSRVPHMSCSRASEGS
jgi:hypothetical protein